MPRLHKLKSDNPNKIIKEISAERLKSAIKCTSISINNRPENLDRTTTPILTTQSDGSLIKKGAGNWSLKQKLVNKVRSWNNKDGRGLQNTAKLLTPDISTAVENLSLSNEVSEDNLFKSDWIHAKDSLEDLVSLRTDKQLCSEVANSKSVSFPSTSKENDLSSTSPISEPLLGRNRSVIDESFGSKMVCWDPWDKLSRKNRKENKQRKKIEKSPIQSRESSKTRSSLTTKDRTSGDVPREDVDEPLNSENPNSNLYRPDSLTYEYQPYYEHARSVEFTNQVTVVYFNGDDVLCQDTEPLKKEVEQQVRNKEMRKGHIPATITSRKSHSEDYMAAWFKK